MVIRAKKTLYIGGDEPFMMPGEQRTVSKKVGDALLATGAVDEVKAEPKKLKGGSE